jgi:hypothetical protein
LSPLEGEKAALTILIFHQFFKLARSIFINLLVEQSSLRFAINCPL